MRTRKNVDEHTKKLICELYSLGKEPAEIGKLFKISANTVTSIRYAAGLPPHHEGQSQGGKTRAAQKKSEKQQIENPSAVAIQEKGATIVVKKLDINKENFTIHFEKFDIREALKAIKEIVMFIPD